jgi:CRISPR-associated endonuclease/helicase Cas3
VKQILAHPDQSLVQHLLGVARRAKDFAAHFHGEDHANLAGLLHDLGKADAEFQKRISKEGGEKRPHAHHGAAMALEHQLWPVAFAINGHHAGLHNRSDLQQIPSKWASPSKTSVEMLKGDTGWPEQTWPISEFGKTLPKWLDDIPFATTEERDAKMRAVDFYTRMLFSALVDADRLDTEEANPSDGSQTNVMKRKLWRFAELALAAKDAPETLLFQLDEAIAERIKRAREKNASQAVCEVRAEVLELCRTKATTDRGVFTLNVPTGGGKTLASIAFALEHMRHHNSGLEPDDPRRLRRIIVVIPYLNIIQQTTKELREVFHDDASNPDLILEHHSQASDPKIDKKDKDADGWDKERPLRQLAAENWDAPIIVTTSVQYFDSLFSRRPADARKLHNICQSVVIFDEVQTLPPLLLQPILDALKELTNPSRPYGCSLLLCTATQPALGNSNDFEFGFQNQNHIIAPEIANSHFAKLKRVEYHGLSKESPPPVLSNEDLASALLGAPGTQALAILNTRKQARALFDTLVEKTKATDLVGGIFHLSTWMYPAHRLEVLAEVTRRLNAKKPCILVATQCVEAGVDLDFPAVWRAFGPYDSIVQAAGRCNRSGALRDASGQPILGQVFVFEPADASAPQGTYGSAMQNAELLRKMGKALPDDPASFETYFKLLYQTTVPDPGGCAVQSAREKLHFKEVSEMFNYIDADTVPLLVEDLAWTALPAPSGYSKGGTLLDWLRDPKGFRTYQATGGSINQGRFLTAEEWRTIQPYIVGLTFPTSVKTRNFIREHARQVFPDDEKDGGLHVLNTKTENIYQHGLHGAGLSLDDTLSNEFLNI